MTAPHKALTLEALRKWAASPPKPKVDYRKMWRKMAAKKAARSRK